MIYLIAFDFQIIAHYFSAKAKFNFRFYINIFNPDETAKMEFFSILAENEKQFTSFKL